MTIRLCQSVISIAVCIVLTGCTTTKTISEGSTEIIREASATSIRPTVTVVQYPIDRPALRVLLGKRLEGPIELEVQKKQAVQTIWGQDPGTVIFGWFELALGTVGFPLRMVILPFQGNTDSLEKVLHDMGAVMLAATGFNTPSGWHHHIKEKVIEGAVEHVGTARVGSKNVPWRQGLLTVWTNNQIPLQFYSDWEGVAEVDLKRLPIDLVHPAQDLHLIAAAELGGVTVQEEVNVTVPTMLAWPEKEAEFARKEQERKAELAREERERKAREEREAIAKRERAAEERKEALARRAQERQEREAERARLAEERAESDANFNLMMQGVGMLGEIVAAQQQQKAMVDVPSVPIPRSAPSSSAAIQSMTQMAEALTTTPGSNGSSAPSQHGGSPPSASNGTSRNQHNPANEASRCISIDNSKSAYGVSFVNNCSFTIEITWCANTQRQPNNCAVGGYDSTSAIRAGGKTSIDSLEKALSWEYGACRNGTMYYTSEMSRRREYKCVDR